MVLSPRRAVPQSTKTLYQKYTKDSEQRAPNDKQRTLTQRHKIQNRMHVSQNAL